MSEHSLTNAFRPRETRLPGGPHQPTIGATRSHTMNEEGNAGIRRVNARLGYQIQGGMYRLRRAR